MAIRIIKKKFSFNSSRDMRDFDCEQKQGCIQYLLDKGLSVLQISKVTGIRRYSIYELSK